MAELDRAVQLGDRVVDPGGGDDADAEQPIRRGRAELGEPLVVRANARDLQLAVVGVGLGAGEGDAREEHDRMDAVDVHVVEPRLRVEAAGADVVVADTLRLVRQVTVARRSSQPERPRALAVVERPDVAAVGVHDTRRRGRGGAPARGSARGRAARSRARRHR